MKKCIQAFASIGALLCGIAVSSPALSQTYPSKPVRIVVPYPPGDLADIIARLLGTKLGEQLGQPFVIENRPGASGMVGLQNATHADPDGYTLVMGQMGSMAIAPLINKQPFDVREEFVPVALAYTNYMLLVANPNLPVKTVPELIAYAKANPGKLKFGTNGEGGFPHLAAELFKERSGFDFTHVPYKGSSQVTTDVIGGQVDLTLAGFSSLYPYVQEGRLKAIAITGQQRASVAPGIPTMGESIPGYDALGWFGLFAPKGTPAATIATLNSAVNRALKMPDVMQKADTLGLDAAPTSAQGFDAIWKSDYDKWGKIIAKLNLSQK